jgi:hypothetical protein
MEADWLPGWGGRPGPGAAAPVAWPMGPTLQGKIFSSLLEYIFL